MILRPARNCYARVALILVLAALAVLIPASPLYAAPDSQTALTVYGTELQGFLAAAGDMHFLGLETTGSVEEAVITLAYRVPEESLVRDGVNFVVLAEQGLRAYLAGTPLEEAAATSGATLHSGAAGAIAQATLPVDQPAGYTVVVRNQWQAPANYILTVHGGTLIDEGGQTLLRVGPQAEMETRPIAPLDADPSPMRMEEEPVQILPGAVPEMVELDRNSPGTVESIRGNLQAFSGRAYFSLRPANAEGEILVRLAYRTGTPLAAEGTINFWVLTQDGLRHVIQGALPMELNLATGRRTTSGGDSEMTAALRLAGQEEYALIVFNESAYAADYEVIVEGARLLDSTAVAAADKGGGFPTVPGRFTAETPGLDVPAGDASMALGQP